MDVRKSPRKTAGRVVLWDNFTDSDSTTIANHTANYAVSPWRESVGQAIITSNQLARGASTAITGCDLLYPDVDIHFTMGAVAGAAQGLYFRGQTINPNDDCLIFYLDGVNNLIYIAQSVATVFTVLVATAHTIATTSYDMRLICYRNQIRLLVDSGATANLAVNTAQFNRQTDIKLVALDAATTFDSMLAYAI